MLMPFDDDGRRRELAQFLKDRRARITPASAGVPTGARRRARGLLREEVAMIAGVGLTWYTWLEQARPIKPSVRVLGSLARALRLSDVERTHLFRLARPDLEPSPAAQLTTAVSAPLKRTMDCLAPNPAYAVNAVWDVIGWNKPATLVFGDFAAVDLERRNLLHLIFCDPAWRKLLRDWETIAAFAVAQFRESTARLGGDPRFKELVGMLERDSESFRRHWRRRDVCTPAPQSKVLDHARAGRLDLDYATFQADSDREVRLTIYTPANSESAQRMAALAPPAPRKSRTVRSSPDVRL
jgi:transcriptional regulator with XRE-family HTH domain